VTASTPGVLFGAAYYAEYQLADLAPGETVDVAGIHRDLDLMLEAGFTVIPVGESVWSTWEPEPGRFELDWLQPVLDAAHDRGIAVIVGTPTYAIPMWLKRLHPEVALDIGTGRPMHWGARQEVDVTHAAFLFYAERIIRQVVGRYAAHPAVIGIQVDNEPGIRLPHNENVFQRFTDHLRHTYGDVETLNREWGLVYWSHRLSTWADLWRPDGNFQPQYELAWRRFQAGLFTEFIGWQADLVREITADRPGLFVTTCISYEQLGVEDADMSARLDIASGNAYYEMEEHLAHPSDAPRSTDWIIRGTWGLFQLADQMWSSKQGPFLVTETDAGSIGFSSKNVSPYDGQWRQAAWALVSRGARMIEYWHWQTLHAGAETWWGGVLPHSRKPGRAFREMGRIGAEFQRIGAAFEGAVPDADVTILYDSDSKFALSGFSAPFGAPGQYFDPDSYRRIVTAFHRGAFDAGRQVRLVRPQQLFATRGGAGLTPERAATEHPILLVPAFYTVADDELAWLDAYAAAGGHLVLGPRSLYADREGRARLEVKPSGIAAAAGVWYDESANLAKSVPVVAPPGSLLALSGSAVATDWADGLEVDGADVLARYDHPHLGRWAAVTTRSHGGGRVTVVGTVPGQELATALAAWLAPVAASGLADMPSSVTAASSTAADGSRLVVLHNWSWEPAAFPAVRDYDDLLTDPDSDARIAASDDIRLGPWDVRVLREH
jgi:beta-galactosidase